MYAAEDFQLLWKVCLLTRIIYYETGSNRRLMRLKPVKAMLFKTRIPRKKHGCAANGAETQVADKQTLKH